MNINLSSLSADQFGSIVKLLKQREQLQAELTKVNAAIAKIAGTVPAAFSDEPSTGKGRGRRRGRRNLKASVIAELKTAGSKGMAVKDLSVKLGVPAANIFSWFYTTGKKIKDIQKVGEGRYALK
jgi:hypothetical protein